MKILSREKVALRVATAGTVAVGGMAFALSFTALSELSADNGVSQAWLIPLVVEGGMVVATAATVTLKDHRWLAWTMMVLSSLAAVVGNVVHAQPHGVIAMVIAAIPPLWLLASAHLTVMLVRQDGAEPNQIDTEEHTVLVAA
ncbi:hypothetical protein SEA_JSQUARED_35 [Mycobacterium phage Jsquared]|uniref:excisionase n=1 Tax=Mycobacterium phage Serenity TaxID=1701853 RepID=UPI0006CE2F66|nr:excisionase [Mycobacterium phage Serenity]ALF00903.1 hypothetical protein SEA_SERENITY_36 [Mycobacterium phage Serenity]AVP41882.1 hypothetical protein SEA_JSQUARED_35 [Mycobacterium phage Jsquared]